MKGFFLLTFFFGVLSIVIGYINQIKKCPPPTVEYRYVPRTFKEEQENPVQVSQLFQEMFDEPSPWVAGFKLSGRYSKDTPINRYFISQAIPR